MFLVLQVKHNAVTRQQILKNLSYLKTLFVINPMKIIIGNQDFFKQKAL